MPQLKIEYNDKEKDKIFIKDLYDRQAFSFKEDVYLKRFNSTNNTTEAINLMDLRIIKFHEDVPVKPLKATLNLE